MTLLPPGRTGAQLYALVEAYEALGVHRTGTEVDGATRTWLRDLLAGSIAVEEASYGFDRFDHDSELTADGEPVDHLPLFYEATAELDADHVACAGVSTIANFRAPGLDDAITHALSTDRAALAVATRNPRGHLVAFNRAIRAGSGLPVVLVADHDEDRITAAGRLHLRYRATTTRAQSANVVARAGDTGPAVVITTPLTGWWRCAGERGPGIALAVDLAFRLAEVARVTLIATTGHELEHVGARAWLDAQPAGFRPDAVVHLGASIATGPPVEGFHGNSVMTHVPTAIDERLAAVYAGSDQVFVGAPAQWVSEGREWSHRTDRLLSFGGSFPLFHTPADTAAASTSPARLDEASRLLDDAVTALLDI